MGDTARLINADVNGARNILRKFKKSWFDLVTRLKQVIRVRIYEFGKDISESLLFAGIRSRGQREPATRDKGWRNQPLFLRSLRL
ncbi:hypothetical protein [Desulfurobacterium sp.]